MDADSKWKAYNLAQSRLELLIGHYSEVICNEEQMPSPDRKKIEQWENEQSAVIDQRDALRIDDEETNLQTAQAIHSLPGLNLTVIG